MNPKWKLGVLFLPLALAPLWPALRSRARAAQVRPLKTLLAYLADQL
jgi:hypothetical protein